MSGDLGQEHVWRTASEGCPPTISTLSCRKTTPTTGPLEIFRSEYERDFNEKDRLILSVRHELSRFEIPKRTSCNKPRASYRRATTSKPWEPSTISTFFHPTASARLRALFAIMRMTSIPTSSRHPSSPFRHNYFNEGYFKGTYSRHYRNQEFKAGVESDNTFLHENFNYVITDPSQFDPDTPPTLSFLDSRPDLEQSAFVEDMIRLGKWTCQCGLAVGSLPTDPE